MEIFIYLNRRVFVMETFIYLNRRVFVMEIFIYLNRRDFLIMSLTLIYAVFKSDIILSPVAV